MKPSFRHTPPDPLPTHSPATPSLLQRGLCWCSGLLLAGLMLFGLARGGHYIYEHYILEPTPLPNPEAQRELESMQKAYGKHADTSKAELDLLHLFSRTHDVEESESSRGLTILRLTCLERKPALVEYLLRNGADPSRLSKHSPPPRALDITICNTPLFDAVDDLRFCDTPAEREAAIRIFRLLLEAGAKTEQPELSPPDTALRCCADTPRYFDVPARDLEPFFLLLLEHGASIESEHSYPLTCPVALNGWVEATRRLLAMKAPLESYGLHAIHGAAYGAATPGALECARLLLEAGADANARATEDNPPYSALMFLIVSKVFPGAEDAEGLARCGEMVQLLMQYGAKLDEPWDNSTEAQEVLPYPFVHDRALAKRLCAGMTIAEVMQELRPELAAWLAAHSCPLPTPANPSSTHS